MAFTEGDYISAAAGADLHASAHLIVKFDANSKVVLATAATDDIIGVLEVPQQAGAAGNIFTSGGSVSVAHISGSGTFEVIAGASIAKGQYLTTNASSQAVPVTATSGASTLAGMFKVFGRARYAANSGDLVEYEKLSELV